MSQIRTQLPTIHSSLAADPVLAELVAEFVTEIPGRLARLRRHLESEDWDSLRRSAHQLRGAAGSYGFDPITPLAAEVETLVCQRASPKQVASATHVLIAHCQRMSADTAR